MNQEKQRKNLSPELRIFILQISAVIILLLAVFIIKMLDGSFYGEVRSWYVANFEDDTNVNEVIHSIGKDDTADVLNQLQSGESSPVGTVKASNNLILVSALNSTPVSGNSLLVPVPGAAVSSPYGYRNNPIKGGIEFHSGTDFAADSGTAIVAAASGTVCYKRQSPSYGNYLIIDHGGGLKTLYAHCRSLDKNVGEKVNVGDIIATVGNTGNSTGPHLHFEVLLNDVPMNAEWLLDMEN